MPGRLRRSDPATGGIARRRRGKGFSYHDAGGRQVTDPATLERIRSLAVPPAWEDVWICPWPNGHIQAVGTDAAGRRQYRYHDAWRERRDREKFSRTVEFGRTLPRLRTTVTRDLASDGLSRERVLAAMVRLLDIGWFRVGGEEYAEEHDTFGVASLRKEHVRVRGTTMVFDYPAKGSIPRKVEIRDTASSAVVAALRRHRGTSPNLFVYKRDRRWIELSSGDVNAYIKEAAGETFSAKDFRTWSGTVLAAAELATKDPSTTVAGRRRAVAAAVRTVADQLGNTPAVSRSAYVDPRVVERFESGETIADLLPADETFRASASGRISRRQRRVVEEAVIELLTDGTG